MAFRYHTDSAAYYDSATTKALTQAQLRDVRNAIADGMGEDIAALVKRYTAGEITLAEWADAFGQLVRTGTTVGYALGIGGANAMDTEAIRQIDRLLAEQTDFVHGFINDLAYGSTSDAQMEARAQLYAGQAVKAYEQARASAWSVDLPAYPGDGGTECLGRCRCFWTIEDDETQVMAWWNTHEDDGVCNGCFQRGQDYSPFVQAKGWQ